MSQGELADARKTLLKLYSDNTLEFAGFGLGVIVALATELAGHDEISSLRVPLGNSSLFPPVLFSTFVFGAFMFFRSAFWGRVAEVTVTRQFLFHPTGEQPDIMKAMYDFRISEAKTSGPLGRLVYSIWRMNLGWVAFLTIVAFILGILVP